MASSIEKLTKRLKRDCKHINNYVRDNSILGKILNRQAGDGKIFEILRWKGIFPYELTDSIEKLKYEKLMRDDFYIEERSFYSSLRENVSEEDFGYYLKVWNMLKETILSNYSDL